MAGEQSEAFPEELREWVERRASERGTEPGAVLARAVATYRYLDDADGEEGVDIDALESRVDDLEADLDTKITDVRERVIQVKRETDAKAPADHDHPELRERLRTATRTAEEAAANVEELADRLDRGFENYEEVLEYLTDATDDLDAKTTTLAGTIIDIRRELRGVATAEHDRQAVDRIRSEANRHGERTAACADCGATVDLGLLSRPNCPHCEATYVEFKPATGFLSTPKLVTGDRPALAEGETAAVEADIPDDPADLFEEE